MAQTTDVAFVSRMNRAIDVFQEEFPNASIALIRLFLTIATRPGATQTELAEYTRNSISTINRQVSDLTSHGQKKGEVRRDGMGLVVHYEDPMDRRRRLISLTARGKRVFQEMIGEA